jgi:hypothetical protein
MAVPCTLGLLRSMATILTALPTYATMENIINTLVPDCAVWGTLLFR